MKALRSGLIVGLLLTPTLAFSLPAMMKQFQTTYNLPASSPLVKAKCSTCHVGKTTRMNPYGKDLAAAINAQGGGPKLTAAILKSVEAKDSDGDGISNGDEIRNGTMPGDPGSPKGK